MQGLKTTSRFRPRLTELYEEDPLVLALGILGKERVSLRLEPGFLDQSRTIRRHDRRALRGGVKPVTSFKVSPVQYKKTYSKCGIGVLQRFRRAITGRRPCSSIDRPRRLRSLLLLFSFCPTPF